MSDYDGKKMVVGGVYITTDENNGFHQWDLLVYRGQYMYEGVFCESFGTQYMVDSPTLVKIGDL